MAGRQHQRRNREINARQRISNNTRPNPRDYKEVWNIFKLQADPQSGGGFDNTLTQGDFVNKIYGNMSEGTNIARLYLVEADELIDPITKKHAKLRLKNNGIPFMGDPDIDSFFSKFLWKGYLQTYTPQVIEKERAMYFLIKENPITDEMGKITNSEVFMLFAAQNKKNQGNQKHSKITMSFIDSNVAKSSTGEMLMMEFYLKPAQPMNVAYIIYRPKTYAMIAPRSFIVGIESEDGVASEVILKVDRRDTNMGEWYLYNIFFIVTSTSSFKVVDVMSSEYDWMLAVKAMFYDANISEDSGIFEAHDGTAAPYNDTWINDEDGINSYRFIMTDEILGVGVGNFPSSFVDYFKSWRAGYGSQIPLKYSFSEEKNGLGLRSVSNWKQTNTFYLADMYKLEISGMGFITQLDSVSIYEVKENFDDLTKMNLFADLVDGVGVIDGVLMDTLIPQVIETNNSNNIEDLVTEGFVLINTNPDNIRESYVQINKTLSAGGDSFGSNTMTLPDPHSTFPQGGCILKRDMFSDVYYSEDGFDHKQIRFNITDGIEEHILNSFEFGGVSGTGTFSFYDKNGNPAIGISTDGEEISLQDLILPSPQRFGALNGRIKILYI